MATCEWCGGTGWGEARPKVGLADKWLRVPCPNPECAYRAEDPRDMLLDAAARYIALRADNGAETAGQAFAAEGVPGGGLLGPREWLRQWRGYVGPGGAMFDALNGEQG